MSKSCKKKEKKTEQEKKLTIMLHFAKSKLQSFKNAGQLYKNIRKSAKFLKMPLWISFLYGRRKELNKNPYQPPPEKYPTPQWKEEGVLLHQQRAAVSHCCSRFQKSWEGQRIEKSHLVQPACLPALSIHPFVVYCTAAQGSPNLPCHCHQLLLLHSLLLNMWFF